jgi:glyoxylase-like metal-dependent hydrolase (beta-lactamase superfamily II)
MVKRQTTILNPRNISDILDSDTSSLGVRSTDIEAVIWSHAHFDHVGDPSTFPQSTKLVVGPGIRDSHWPGYPRNPAAINLDSDIQGRHVREISFDKTEMGAVTIGSFDALDYFGDGSFYILNGPGHSVGHICALARVTVSPDSFVFMGGDSCHHPGVLRPTKYLPCQSQPCHGRLFDRSCESKSESVFTLSPVLTSDYDAALKTVDNIKELDASDDVFVILAHDITLRGNVDFYPSTINDWKAKGYDMKTRWLFCKELENTQGSSK